MQQGKSVRFFGWNRLLSDQIAKPISVYQNFGRRVLSRSLSLAMVSIFAVGQLALAADTTSNPSMIEPSVVNPPVAAPQPVPGSVIPLAAPPDSVVPSGATPTNPTVSGGASTLAVPASATDAHKKSSIYTIKAAVPTHPRAVLKSGNNFLLMEESGLMPKGSDFGYGVYRDDTRYLTEWDMNLNGVRLSPLSSVTGDGYNGRFLYANGAYAPRPDKSVPDQTLLVQRDVVVTDAIYERLSITNFSSERVEGDLGIKFGADFADMFEVRGMPRKGLRGEDQSPEVKKAAGCTLV